MVVTFQAELMAILLWLMGFPSVPTVLLVMRSLPGVVVEGSSTIMGWSIAWVSRSPMLLLPGLVVASSLPSLARPGAGGGPPHALLHQVEPLGHRYVGV